MKNILLRNQVTLYTSILFLIGLNIVAQTNNCTPEKTNENPESEISIQSTLEKVTTSEELKYNELENGSTFNTKENEEPKTGICAVNIDGISYFKSGGNTYFTIDLQTESPTQRFRKWSKKRKINVS